MNKYDKNNSIENLIDQKIKDAKLDRYEEQLIISKNQLNFFFKIGGALLAIFGIIIPVYMSFSNTEKVNTAIELMEKRVETILDLKLRIPKIIAMFEGKEFNPNSELTFTYILEKDKNDNLKRKFTGTEEFKIEILNHGTGPAKELRIHLYLQSDSLINYKYPTGDIGWKKWHYSNEPEYPHSLSYQIDRSAIVFILDVTETIPVKINYHNFLAYNLNINNINAILKVYFGEPEPLSIPFKITFKQVAG